MKLQKLKDDLFKKEIPKNQQGIINGGTWTLTNCIRTGNVDDCSDRRWEGSGPAPIGYEG